MTCSATASDSGLTFTSWCDPCDIDDGTGSEHFIEVVNRKPVMCTVTVRGVINSRPRRALAKFDGPLAQSDVMWEDTDDLLPYLRQAAPVYVRVFGGERVVKRSPHTPAPHATEYISIEIEYEDRWSPPGYKQKADTRNSDLTINVT